LVVFILDMVLIYPQRISRHIIVDSEKYFHKQQKHSEMASFIMFNLLKIRL